MVTVAQHTYRSNRRNRIMRGGPLTHYFAIPTDDIDTDTVFPDRTTPITFRTSVRIDDNAGTHQGLVWHFGTSTNAAYLYLNDSVIGVGFGGVTAGVDNAGGEFDNTVELPVGRIYDLVVALRGRDVRVWDVARGDTELIRARAARSLPSGIWCGDGEGTFGGTPTDATHTLIPAAVRQAPDGFSIVEPLRVSDGTAPRSNWSEGVGLWGSATIGIVAAPADLTLVHELAGTGTITVTPDGDLTIA